MLILLLFFSQNYDSFLYTYCSWLLIQKPGKSFYHATRGEGGYTAPEIAWYDEYDLPIGNPLSDRYQKNNCWIRDYTNAKIIVNPGDMTLTIIVDEQNHWLDWANKKAVKTIEMPPRSGRILLPIHQGTMASNN